MVARLSSSYGARSREEWILAIYVSGRDPRSKAAIATARALCETHIAGQYQLHVIDLSKDPTRAVEDGIFAVPTLIRYKPPPYRKLVGDMTRIEPERMLRALA